MNGGALKSLMLLVESVLNDIEGWCGTSTRLDLKTVKSRVEDEGVSFLTITLANFGKDLQKGLDQGFVDHDLFKGFSFKGGLPRFLGGFLDLIFDRNGGRLLIDPSVVAIRALRQFTLMWAKILLDCSDERIKAAFDEYIETEQSVREADARRTDQMIDSFKRIASLVFRDVFSKIDREIYLGNIIPKHGPGTTQDATIGNRKYLWNTWTDRMEYLFPAREFLATRYGFANSKCINWLEPGTEPPVRVITVPKTLKTPRIIAIEPVHMQYVQQGLLEQFVEKIHEDDISRSFIRFDDQTPNQRLALKGSREGDLATLDLSAASDRVSNQLVRDMFSHWPHLFEAVDSTRSRKADVNGKVIRLAKFASMGSALCFPVESLVFITVALYGIEQSLKRHLTRKDLKALSGSVRTFGDDIIVPVKYVHDVVNALSDFGLKVNVGKSYWTGKFRESCGKDYYDGFDVSVVKLRRDIPTRRQHAEEIVSLSSFRNQCFKADLYETANVCDRILESLIPYPSVGENSPVIGKHVHPTQIDVGRMCINLQRPLVKGVKIDVTIGRDPLNDDAALLKYFLKRGPAPLSSDHLERAGRARSIRIKPGWFSAL